MIGEKEVERRHRRIFDGEVVSHMHRRIDEQDQSLLEIKELVLKQTSLLNFHIQMENEIKPALEELVTLWRGSKVMGRIIIGISAIGAIFGGFIVWVKDHVK